jgi:glycosyltransferase involved in cell wall biosynthesis
MKEETSVDYIAKVGEDTGIGNYSTKLYYALEEQEDLELNIVSLDWSFPLADSGLLDRLVKNFLEVPYRVLRSDADIQYLASQRRTSGLFFLPERSMRSVVATVHDIGPYVNDYMGKLTQFISHFYVGALQKLENIISISQYTSNELQEELGIEEGRITTIYQGVDQEYFSPQERDEEILEEYGVRGDYVLFLGTEIPRKNMEDTMKLFSELKEEHPELKLVKAGNAGSQKYRERTLEAMRENNLEKGEDVIFTGFIDAEDLPQIYSSAEATLLLSHYEGLGRPIMESLACGTPVLANDIAPMNEILPETMLANAEDSAEFLEKYRNREEDSEENRKIVKEYTWERTAEQTAEVFRDVR